MEGFKLTNTVLRCYVDDGELTAREGVNRVYESGYHTTSQQVRREAINALTGIYEAALDRVQLLLRMPHDDSGVEE